MFLAVGYLVSKSPYRKVLSDITPFDDEKRACLSFSFTISKQRQTCLSSEFVECYIMHVTFPWIGRSLAELKDQWESRIWSFNSWQTHYGLFLFQGGKGLYTHIMIVFFAELAMVHSYHIGLEYMRMCLSYLNKLWPDMPLCFSHLEIKVVWITSIAQYKGYSKRVSSVVGIKD